jgi:hypothetical protein
LASTTNKKLKLNLLPLLLLSQVVELVFLHVPCPTGEIHKAAIAFEATSTGPSSAIGDWDISTHSVLGDVFKSGTILGGQISTSGHFTLTGKKLAMISVAALCLLYPLR